MTRIIVEAHDHEVAKLFTLLIHLIRSDEHNEDKALERLSHRLERPTERLADAVESVGVNNPSTSGVGNMQSKKLGAGASPALQDLSDQVTKTTGVVNSAITFINGIPALIQSAVDAALANGATAAELAPVVALGDTMGANADALAAAIAANPGPTPPGPNPPVTSGS